MVVIRLSRGGSKGRPFFNIVVADKRSRRDGSFIERVGFYNPNARGQEEKLRVSLDRVNYWLSVGAQASDTVKRLLKQAPKLIQTVKTETSENVEVVETVEKTEQIEQKIEETTTSV